MSLEVFSVCFVKSGARSAAGSVQLGGTLLRADEFYKMQIKNVRKLNCLTDLLLLESERLFFHALYSSPQSHTCGYSFRQRDEPCD